MIVSAAIPAHIAVLCMFPIRLVTLQHARTDLTCACSLPLAIAKRSYGKSGRLLCRNRRLLTLSISPC